MKTLVGQRYEVFEKVGHGGMQTVHRAHDARLNRFVALKTPHGASAAKRFEESAQLSARVRNPNVASALDYFVDTGVAYFVEELIDGINLQEAFDQHFPRLCADTTARTLHHLARGVAASHAVEVIHRDLKPSNIMVSKDLSFSMVKITDFGIAKLAEQKIDEDLKNQADNTATSSTLLGAIPFMAPEAVSKTAGIAPGKPMDVWALGAIAFWMLTGKHPFGSDITAVIGILKGVPPEKPNSRIMGGATHELANQLWDVILGCLQSDPKKRPSADELADRCAAMRYLDEPRVTATIRSKHETVPVWFGIENIAFPTGEFVSGSPGLKRRVSCFVFDGNPSPRGVSIIQLKDMI